MLDLSGQLFPVCGIYCYTIPETQKDIRCGVNIALVCAKNKMCIIIYDDIVIISCLYINE